MTIKVLALGESAAEVLIFDVIGADFFGEGVTAKTIKSDLDALGDVDDITVRVNSPGGNVWDGLSIFNLLKEHKAQIHVQVEGLAASAASLIAMAGDLITMGEGSMMMIHNPMTLAFGDGNEMRKIADVLDKIKGQFVDVYARRSGEDAAAIGEMMDAETWLSGAEAVDKGFADETTADKTKHEPDAAWDRVISMFKHPPAAVKAVSQVSSSKSGRPDATSKEEDPMGDKTQASVTQADIDKAATAAASAAVKAESDRRQSIKTAFGRYAEPHRSLMETCLDDVNCTVDNARAKLLDKLGEGSGPIGPGSVVSGQDARDKFRTGVQNALMGRMRPSEREVGNEFNGATLAQIAGRCLEMNGISVRGLSPDGIARKVLASMSTSDFPQLLSNTAGKVLRDAYGNFPNTWQEWCYRGSVSDFKIHPRIQMGSFNGLATIPEGGEYTYGSLTEEYENAQASTKGKGLILSRQMIVNDDLGGFNRRAQLMGRAAARSVNVDAYTLLTSGSGNHGPTSSDTGQFFNDTAVTTAGGHANLLDSGGAITAASIAVGRTAMRKQKDAGLNETLNILPKVLLAPVAVEDVAWTVINSATDVSQANPSKKNYVADVARLSLVTDPFLDTISATRWYLFADPMDAAAAFEVVFLDGQDTPFIDDMIDFDTDAMKFKVRLDYGVALGDWRGGYANDGA